MAAGREVLDIALQAADRAEESFPVALATAWTYLTDSKAEARTQLEALADMLRRDPDQLSGQVLIGDPEYCASLLGRYAEVGVDSVFIWPIGDPVAQLERFGAEVVPRLG